MTMARPGFPDNRRFAFTIFDDTDESTLENVAPVYRLLADLGFRTTKSVWPLPSVPGARVGGTALDCRPYLDLVRGLQGQGFEIALHNVRNHDAPRAMVEEGFARFHALLGHYPRLHANHSQNRENIYWGAARLGTALVRSAYSVATRFARDHYFQGHVAGSPYFWGDLCQQHIRYVRNFTFNEINLDRINPTMPYRDPSKPYVNYWFSACDGTDVETFCSLLTEANQDRLEAEGGVCIVYTHFGKGFCRDGRLDPRFEGLMRRLAGKPGWFVPVTELLDHLRVTRNPGAIPRAELGRMERRWLYYKLRVGTT
jgi:hypothetical protein